MSEVLEARKGGMRDGATAMRDRLATMLGSWATTHPDNVVADELWQFVDKVRKLDIEE